MCPYFQRLARTLGEFLNLKNLKQDIFVPAKSKRSDLLKKQIGKFLAKLER